MSHDVIIMVRYRPGDDQDGNERLRALPDVTNGHDTGIARLETPDWNESVTYHRHLAVRHNFLPRLERCT